MSKKPYGLMADIHFHKWTSFSKVLENGRNSRLEGLLQETIRCAEEVKAAGGDTIYIAGDVFHVRGNISPSVLNPVLDVIGAITALGITVRVLAGNHDLENKHSNRLGSAITSLESVGARVCNETTVFEDDKVVMIPWFESLDDLKNEIRDIEAKLPGEYYDLLLHAPLDGVIPGLPEHGLNADFFKGMTCFDFVFSGHYHNHKKLSDKVYSIGALAHHSWSDVGSKAGFLLVDDNVTYRKSRLPQFIDITEKVDPEELPLIVDGNYVRIKTESASLADVEQVRSELAEMGAKGVVIQSVKKPVSERDGSVAATVSAGASLEVSVAEYVKTKCTDQPERVALECMNILAEAGV